MHLLSHSFLLIFILFSIENPTQYRQALAADILSWSAKSADLIQLKAGEPECRVYPCVPGGTRSSQSKSTLFKPQFAFRQTASKIATGTLETTPCDFRSDRCEPGGSASKDTTQQSA